MPLYQYQTEINILNNGMANEDLVTITRLKFAFNDLLNRFLVDLAFQPGYDV